MIERFAQFPRDLATRAKSTRFGEIPVLLAHPDWDTPTPVVIWLHGRTAYKELDPGRYLRWVRAGFAACAIDLPGHGERAVPSMQSGHHTPEVLKQAVGELDRVIESLASREWGGVFDLDRMGIGGMSAGGMIVLRRLCDPHPFRCAAVEGTSGWLGGLYFPEQHGVSRGSLSENIRHDDQVIRTLDPMQHLDTFTPLPLLILHSESDAIVPWQVQRRFLDALRTRYKQAGVDPALIEVTTWSSTGAPHEHLGFGKVSNDAKNLQTDFFSRHLRAAPLDDAIESGAGIDE